MPNYTPINQSANAAPSAGRPGMGAGNVPHAPGVISGNLGQTGQAPLARQSQGATPINPPQGPPPPAPVGQAPQASPSGPAPGQPPPPNMQAISAFYLNFLESYLLAIKESVNKPLVGGQY